MILDVPDGPPERGFLAVARPLAAPTCERLAAGAREIAGRGNAPFDPATAVPLLWPAVEGRLLTILGRTLVVELHLARNHGALEGATPEERFQSFLGFLGDPGIALDILRDYPALKRQIAVALDLWVESSLEFLSRLAADASALREAFSPDRDPGRLIGLDGGGDVHRRGRAVLIATFASGLRVVYKPRPLTVDVRFQELLAWIGARSTLPPFRTLTVLDRGDHGWMEFVETVPCQTTDEVRRFHLRLGGLLALLYVLEATDVHFENLLAAGEQPVLVDLESLLHPRPRPATPEQADLRIAGAALARSVLRVGLLPFQVGAAEGYDGIDLSGLAAVEGELSPNRVLCWENAGTDEMVAVRRRMPMPGAQNRPRLRDREVDALDHLDDLLEGFTEMVRLLERDRAELESILGRFADAPVRAILRATRGYHLLWFESFHPDLLRDEADRDRFLGRLRVGIEELPHLEALLPFEERDLRDGDIPAFESRPGSRDLWTWDGQRLADFFDRSALESTREKLSALGEDDLRFQTWLIRASLSTLVHRREVVDWPSYEPREPDGEVSFEALQDRLIDQARAVGDRLASLALRKDGCATWIGLELSQRRWSLLPVGEDLYAGLPGIALFLAHLGDVANDVQATELAREALATLRDRLRHTAPTIYAIGAFQGWGGIIYTLTHIAVLWNDLELLAEAEALLDQIPPRIETDQDLDIIGGAAGCIEGLLSLVQAGAGKALEIARLCGDFLVRRAEPVEGGLGWRSRLAADLPQTGFSHGAAGIAHALWRLADAAGDELYRDTARGAFLYEHGRYDPMQENWLDIGDKETAGKPRQGGEKATCMAWCYGAPGVGLSRLTALGSGAPFLREDLEAALRATQDRGFGFNHSLCHGDLGNLDLLIQAEKVLARPDLRIEIARRAWSILESLERSGRLCGTPLGLEVPGLMNGLAGIGYGLLRLAAPKRVPSVLSLDQPS